MTLSANRIESQHESAKEGARVSDTLLIDRAVDGDEAALRALMNRYDRLVRFTIFRIGRDRCRQDPAWLDTVAGDAWVGFIQSVQRSGETPDVPVAYIVRIARNKAISALRSATRDVAQRNEVANPVESESDQKDDPALIITGLEELDALRACMAQLDSEDRELATQLSAITERRWRDAAAALGLAESTVRSRWKRVLDRLRACLTEKTGRDFAPSAAPSDE